ncbi:hypothetical protein [Nocardia farcinica]|uniref:hypothetical protein n=1 Tax=Nocardia farcinica TaxID=37329 RepID=UPI002458AF5C|nr:hypothetical protein [Nocardia farcinica]
MASSAQLHDLLETIEQGITARNWEDYREEYPDWPAPVPPYSTWLALFVEQWAACVSASYAEVVTSGSDGRAVVEFPEMVAPVVAVGQTTHHLVIVESVTATSATVRVLDGPTGVQGVDVHVTVTDTAPAPEPEPEPEPEP